ncbi:MAG: serine/threonine protein kinase [Gammaproteobacteria bacterium]|nr:serine/threonine protein kinase [Gammaproteobacteria bacterium]
MDKRIEHALPAGYALRQYRIERTLGGGGFSIVYLAQDTQNQRLVVIKEYLPSNQARREGETVESLSAEANITFKQGIKRFFEEAASLATINHPNIVRVVDFFRDNNTVYLVMVYEDGKDLRWYIKRHGGRLSEKFIRTVFPQLLLGLRELHANNLLHLDIKPANIFLRPGGKPLLLDFGAAQPAYREGRVQTAHTLTLGYAPIEQHRRGHLGPWTDIYALGASMWSCMGGRPPYPSLERAERDKQKSAVRTFSRYYSKQLLEIVDWCLKMDQIERPQTAQQLLDVFNQTSEPAAESTELSLLDRLKLPWRKRPSE